MAALRKTIVATGCSSGLGFEAIKKLLGETQPYRFILGARNPKGAEDAFDGVKYNKSTHTLSVLPLELSSFKGVKTFAQQVQEKLGQDKLDILLLNAAVSMANDKPGPEGSKWSEAIVVNHFTQHYLIHLLREKLVESKARIVVVSSGAIRMVSDTSVLESSLKANSGTPFMESYSQSKFVQLLGANWWRRQLMGQCDVVATSPGLIPGTGLGRYTGFKLEASHPDAKSVEEGGANVIRAMFVSDLPENPEQIFLTSWGEWWSTDVYASSLDKALQDKWCPSLEEIENNEGILAP
ncbi:hypothetical protein S40285_04519 [Stachybotrys chlorohalonatus IBT 40285]|uniref:Uncharacterized protein n=1 Tax=Stachybotrys chlorohalonatus (strain IBT 40285) TaxID=1283841 RepID=A0A084QV14_STAC4|nr:hypothetical protein S40285_04519 [Stachybotrys chlorohalonata IBT 40285]